MKIKNKIRINIVIAAFIAIFAVGTVFALVADEPLRFNVFVNVDMDLTVGIDMGQWGKSVDPPTADVYLLMPMFDDPIPGLGGFLPVPWGFGRTANLNLTLSGTAGVEMTYWIENLGSLYANVYVELWYAGNSPYITITTDFSGPQVLRPGGRIPVVLTIAANMPDGSNIVSETAEFQLILNYERAN